MSFSGKLAVMDHDVAAWVTEEAVRGSVSARRGEPRSQIAGPADRGRYHSGSQFGAPPVTPFTPKRLGMDRNNTGGLGTEMFLRRVRDTAARGQHGQHGQTHGNQSTRSHKNAIQTSTPPKSPRGEDAGYLHEADMNDTTDASQLMHDDETTLRSEERVFGNILSDVRAGSISFLEQPAVFESVCRIRATELRDQAATAQRASTAHDLTSEADALDAEATTWSLCWFLLGEGAVLERENAFREKSARDAIAKRQAAGGDPASKFENLSRNDNPLPAPLSARVRMAARDEQHDPVTFRINRVVAWLEGNQRAALLRETFGANVEDPLRDDSFGGSDSSKESKGFSRSALAAFDAFAKDEVALLETARALDASATSDGRGASLSRALDPDGPMRTRSSLHPTNADAEARLCRAAWRLTRGGMIDAARELCVVAGQPWRAASLGGAAGFGPAPVGAAADAAFASSAAYPVALAMEEARNELGSMTQENDDMDDELDRSTRQSIDIDAAAFAAIADNAHSDAANAEDEELAAECDDVSSGSMNGSNSDSTQHSHQHGRRSLWKWACAETARQIIAAPSLPPAARHEAALYGAFCGDVRATLPVCESDWEDSAWALFRALLDQRVDAAVGNFSVGDIGEALMDDDDDGKGSRAMDDKVPSTPRWPTSASLSAIPTTAESILEALNPLAERESHASVSKKAQRDTQRCLILGRTRELAVEIVTRWVFRDLGSAEVLSKGAEKHDAEPVTNNPMGYEKTNPPNPTLLRFATHLLLFLQDALPENGGGLQPNGALNFHLNKIVNLYVVHLIAERRYSLVPRYARHLRPQLLVETYARFLELLAPCSNSTKTRVIKEASQWIPLEGEAGVRAILTKTLDDSREVFRVTNNSETGAIQSIPSGAAATRGPDHRENVLRWACVPGTQAMHAETATHACALVRQLCLGRTSQAVGLENAQRDGLVGVQGVRTLGANSHKYSDHNNSGESSATRIVAEVLPPDLQRNAAESEAPGAAAELGDWAAFLAACASARAWRDAACAREIAGAVLRNAGTSIVDDVSVLSTMESAKSVARDAARAAVSGAISLAEPREPERGFYEDEDVPSTSTTDGFWLDSEVLVDGPEAILRGLVSASDDSVAGAHTKPQHAVRMLVARVGNDAGDVSSGVSTDVSTDADSLRLALETRAASMLSRNSAVSVTVDSVPGISGEGASAAVRSGQLLVEISVARNQGAAANSEDVAARTALSLLSSEALKGDLPGFDETNSHLECVSCDASDPELVRSICRHVLWPSLLLEAASAEADLGEGTSGVAELVADANRGLHKMFSAREMKQLVQTRRAGELNALAFGAREM